MGMTELYISKYIEWFNHNTWFTYLLIGTFTFMDNVQCNLLWASIFAACINCIYYIYACIYLTIYLSIYLSIYLKLLTMQLNCILVTCPLVRAPQYQFIYLSVSLSISVFLTLIIISNMYNLYKLLLSSL